MTAVAPGRYSGSSRDLIDALAKKHGVKPENIVLGCGSTQILRSVTHVFTAKDKPLVATIPTYEECADYATLMGDKVVGVALDSEFRPDLDRFADAARGAGLVFFCNPSNPSSTYVGARATRDFLARINSDSPDTTILVDEAYFDYVTNPDHETFIPLAVQNPRVIVARTFSKAYGMAGLRIGYAVGHADTHQEAGGLGRRRRHQLAERARDARRRSRRSSRTRRSSPTERARNAAVRDFTMKWFADRGMKPADSQANFMFVNIGRPAKEFRDACRAKGVRVARDFPPFEKTHCRIAFGTMDGDAEGREGLRRGARQAGDRGGIDRNTPALKGGPTTSARRSPALFATGSDPFVDELLQAPSFVGLGREDVPLRVGRDAVDGEELPRLAAAVAEAGEDLQRLAIEHVDLLVLPVGEVEILLLRILRERDVPHRAVAERLRRDERLLHERAVGLEHLDAIVRPVADVDEAVVREVGAVHRRAELLRRRRVRIVRAEVRVVRLVAVGAPVALELARCRRR